MPTCWVSCGCQLLLLNACLELCDPVQAGCFCCCVLLRKKQAKQHMLRAYC
jgi:hypothetical protein